MFNKMSNNNYKYQIMLKQFKNYTKPNKISY